MIDILFICHGNICRSTMAEFLMKDLVRKEGLDGVIRVASAATSREEIGADTHPGTKAKLREMDIPFTKRQAVQVTAQDYDRYDYLIIMDENNRRNLARIIGEDRDGKVFKALHFATEEGDVKDPWYTGNFDETYEALEKSCRGLLAHIRKERSL